MYLFEYNELLWQGLDGSMAAVDQALKEASSPLGVLMLYPQSFPLHHQRLAIDGLAFNVLPENLQRKRKIVCCTQRCWMCGTLHFYKAAVTRTFNDQRFVVLVLLA